MILGECTGKLLSRKGRWKEEKRRANKERRNGKTKPAVGGGADSNPGWGYVQELRINPVAEGKRGRERNTSIKMTKKKSPSSQGSRSADRRRAKKGSRGGSSLQVKKKDDHHRDNQYRQEGVPATGKLELEGLRGNVLSIIGVKTK